MKHRSIPPCITPSRRPRELAATLLSCLLAVAALSAAAELSETAELSKNAEPGRDLESLLVPIDAAHVIAGETTFQILREGKAVGRSVVGVRLGQDAVIIHEVSTLEPDIVEDVEMRLDPTTFAPLATEIRGRFSGTRVEAGFRFADRRITGRVVRHPAGGSEPAEVPVDMAVPEGTFLRGSAIALLPAMPLAAERSLELHWFNPVKTILTRITMWVTGVEQVAVPAGTFESYRVELRGDTPAMTFHVTTAAPRRVVRAEAVGEPLILQLMP